jgi:tripartite ATP-independent transporter DctM subunit
VISWQIAAWILLGGSTALLFLGLPVAFTFLVINLIGAMLWLGGEPGLVQLARNCVQSVTSFSLTPIPLFVLMGEVLFHTGLAVKVIDGIERMISQVPGRLAVVAVVAGTVFSAISGSTIATTAMLGSLMVPVMLARGYHPTMATGPIMAIGAVDMLIPPSALTVLLGSLSGISISKLLIGGVVPGLILSAMFVIYIVVRVKLDPKLAPPSGLIEYHGWERLRPLVQYVLPLVSIFVIVIASMSAGWATPTESAAIGAFATVVLALAYRALTVANLVAALRGTVGISGMILFIIVGATTFSQILSFSGASNGIVALITGQGLSPMVVIAGMMLVLIFLGIFVDQVSMMLITLPIFMPVVQAFGIDLVWFGVMFLICMQLGLLLPPHGLLLMTMKGVSPPQVRMSHIFQAVVPYVAMSILVLVLVFFVPAVALWLPRVLG